MALSVIKTVSFAFFFPRRLALWVLYETHLTLYPNYDELQLLNSPWNVGVLSVVVVIDLPPQESHPLL